MSTAASDIDNDSGGGRIYEEVKLVSSANGNAGRNGGESYRVSGEQEYVISLNFNLNSLCCQETDRIMGGRKFHPINRM